MQLENKTVCFLGDSITEGVGVENLSNRYDNQLKSILNLKEVFNYGISGTRLAHQSCPSNPPRYDLCFCGRAYNLNKDADVIVVYGGVNDYIHGDAPFGHLTDTVPSTFCGAVDFIMNFLKENYQLSKIVFMTPAHMNLDDLSDKNISNRPCKKADAKPLAKYVDVINKKGKQYNIPVLDLFCNLGIDPNNETQKAEYTADGLHFNDKGHGVLAKCLAEFLISL